MYNIIKIIRITLLTSLVIFGFVLLVKDKNYCKDCNVILISIDTLRADHLSAYGYKKNTSPNLVKFVEGATVFQNFYSTAPWTLPAHASMFASDLPGNLKVESIYDKIPSSTLTIAEILKNKGYKTHGFDSDSYVSPNWNFHQGFDSYYVKDSDKTTGSDVDSIFSQAQKVLDQNKNNKFFLFIHTMEVHDPYCPPKSYAEVFKNNYKGKLSCIDWRVINGVNDGSLMLSSDDLERFKSLYDGEIAYTDYYLGLLFNQIKKLGLEKKTIVIITSDHGEEFGERGTWGKHTSTLYNELMKIPLIIKAPNLQSGKDSRLHSLIDVAPTILDLLGIKKPKSFSGQSILDEKKNKVVFFELGDTKMAKVFDSMSNFESLPVIQTSERKIFTPSREKVGLIADEWKLVRTFNPPMLELFNLLSDPLEKNNLAFENQVKARELDSLLIQQFFIEKYSGIERMDKSVRQRDLNRLRDLGY